MKNIMGLLRPSAGSVLVGESDVTHLARQPSCPVRPGPGCRRAGRSSPSSRSKRTCKSGWLPAATAARRFPAEIYDLFPVAQDHGKRMGGDLSGGQQQQLAIGAKPWSGQPKSCSWTSRPRASNPTSSSRSARFCTFLVREMKITVVLVEQYLDSSRSSGTSSYIMNRGQVVAQGTTAELTAEIIGPAPERLRRQRDPRQGRPAARDRCLQRRWL